MKFNHSIKTDLSRRQSIQIMAGASVASLSGTLTAGQGRAKPTSKRSIPFPKLKIHQIDKTAAEIYQCKPDLKRFGSENIAFKIVSEELKGSSARAMAANMIGFHITVMSDLASPHL